MVCSVPHRLDGSHVALRLVDGKQRKGKAGVGTCDIFGSTLGCMYARVLQHFFFDFLSRHVHTIEHDQTTTCSDIDVLCTVARDKLEAAVEQKGVSS